MAHGLTLGVEEEFFVVDVGTRQLVDATPLLASVGGRRDGYPSYADEFRTSMLESRTSACRSLDELRSELCRLRQGLVGAAGSAGQGIVAAGSVPLADWRTQPINPHPRFKRVVDVYARLALEHVVCGCHVHVGIDDRDLTVQVMNRVRPWLPVLLALSASSPFWMGEATGYASYRSVVFARWPVSGIPGSFASFAEYVRVMELVVGTEAAADKRQVFDDVRPGIPHPTLEFRIADSCTRVDEVIVVAALCRALVEVCLDEVAGEAPGPGVRTELLRAARWRASRFGLADRLVDPVSGALLPAASVVDQLLAFVRGGLEQAGDWEEVSMLVTEMQRVGSSAQRQQRVFAEGGTLPEVVDSLVEETAQFQGGSG
ncbi:MAG TPA: glutamate--cysteine ligase [Acidimicrobiales bacterium]|nr:glutamate--cysteine ligase [Acidimicrobiales bacterium]